ncbi:hypothetical protein AXL3_34 [Stenotrophomonas phage vB_SmaS-AXL_3]|uniref:Uncharacterized protein n=1 Tax=Stenotrophomonas phage vB_SmaS-AXL_3 TaxID=2740427 RepID=A0A7D5BZL0_9CAUD|nr:hypothetical protein PQE62_gp34 [Stenotrophomonas phage vB_SmaS-AXL_3]QKW95585.1 hypothetical protein AXL3_34 [Stenotrophomonas phage vB_SmaS-AXL_3]
MKTVIQGGDAIKTYARRDGATAALKKLGIKPADYNMFIFQTTDGRTAATLDKAQEYLQAQLRKVANEEVPQKQLKGRTKKEADTNQIKRPSVAGVIRKLILDGLDNKAIHEVMKRDFGHDEDKAHYPAWYRSQMRREGLIERPAKTAKIEKKDVVNKAVKVKEKKTKQPKKASKKRVAKRKTALAKRNIQATLDASMKTGHTEEAVAPHSHIQVK